MKQIPTNVSLSLAGISRLVRISIIGICYWYWPLFALAAEPIEIFTAPSADLNFGVIATKFSVIANAVIPFLIGVAVVAIVWGIFTYIKSAGDTEKIAKGRETIIYGIIGLFIMLAFWGFVTAVKNSLFG